MKAKNIIVSVGITLTFACLVLLLFYPSGSPLGNLFSIFFILIIMHYVALVYGVLVLCMRLFKLLKNNELLVYLLAGTINVFLSIAGITLYSIDQADDEWLKKCLLNLLIGVLIVGDGLVYKNNVKS